MRNTSICCLRRGGSSAIACAEGLLDPHEMRSPERSPRRDRRADTARSLEGPKEGAFATRGRKPCPRRGEHDLQGRRDRRAGGPPTKTE